MRELNWSSFPAVHPDYFEVCLEDEVEAVLNLLDGPEAEQPLAGATFLFGELGPYGKGPMIQGGSEPLGAEAIGGSLEGIDICHLGKGILALSEIDVETGEFAGDEFMSVEVGGERER